MIQVNIIVVIAIFTFCLQCAPVVIAVFAAAATTVAVERSRIGLDFMRHSKITHAHTRGLIYEQKRIKREGEEKKSSRTRTGTFTTVISPNPSIHLHHPSKYLSPSPILHTAAYLSSWRRPEWGASNH